MFSRGLPGEDYTRPPLYAVEPAPRWIAIWRFRLVALLALAALLVIAVLSFLALGGGGEGSPNIPAPRAVHLLVLPRS